MKIPITELCNIERTQENKLYPAGTVYLQVSATHGQICMTEKIEELKAGKYVVFKPKNKCYAPYMKEMLTLVMPEFMQTYMTGINIQVGELKHLEIEWIENVQQQRMFVENVEKLNTAISNEQQCIERLKEFKKQMLSRMFPQEVEECR